MGESAGSASVTYHKLSPMSNSKYFNNLYVNNLQGVSIKFWLTLHDYRPYRELNQENLQNEMSFAMHIV